MGAFSRRGFLKGVAAASGAALGARLPGAGLVGEAQAQGATTEKAAVVVIHLLGGYNSFFCSADSFLNRSFSVNDGNVMPIGNGLVVDRGSLGALPDFARTHMATIGNRHGSTDHGDAIRRVWSDGARSYAMRLAAEIGGDAPIKCVQVGDSLQHPTPAEGDVTLQVVRDMRPTIDALVGGDAALPDRAIAANALGAARTMSRRATARSPVRSKPLTEGYDAAGAALRKRPPPFDYESLPGVYQTGGTAVNGSFATKLAAAELMVRAGANVIGIFSNNDWDTHGQNGVNERNMFGQILPHLQRFLTRVHDPNGLAATHNVVTVILGDFARSLPGNDHQANLSATVIGKYVKTGTTGKTNANVGLPANTPASEGMWAYIAAAAKLGKTPFGANPHPLVL